MTTAAQTKEHEEHTVCKHTGIRKKKMRKVGSEAQENVKAIVLKESVVTNFPVSAAKPSRGPCHTR